MRILAIETTGDVCSVAIGKGEELLCYQSIHDKNTHSVNLMPLIDRCLYLSDLSIDDVDAFAVNIGPGSFTGIRIGVCTVKGFALEKEKPCIAVNTLDSLAENAREFKGTICPLIDARRCESYYAVYKSDGKEISCLSDYGADKLEIFLGELPEGNVCFVGDGALNYKEFIIEKMGERAVFLDEKRMYPNAKSVLKIAQGKASNSEFVSAYDIMPYYFRKSQAEQMKEKNEGR